MAVYLLTFPNEKRYVGKTAKKLSRRWWEHRRAARLGSQFPVHRALRKYGPENVRVDVLYDGRLLDLLEQKCIRVFQTKAPNGYNLTDGGDGVHGLPLASRMRMGGMRGKRHTDETRAKISSSSMGRVVSFETRRKISERLKGRGLSMAHCLKLSECHKGVKQSAQAVANRVASCKRVWALRGGRRCSEKERRRLSQAQIGKKQPASVIAKRVASWKRTVALRGPWSRRVKAT